MLSRKISPLISWFMLVTVVVGITACGGEDLDNEGVSTTVPAPVAGSATPEEAVTRLWEALLEADYDRAVSSTHPESWLLVAMSEGATPDQIISMDTKALAELGRNFWSNFFQTLAESSGANLAEMQIEDIRRFDSAQAEYAEVQIRYRGQTVLHRLVASRPDQDWKVEVLASFAESLLPRVAAALVQWSNTEDEQVHQARARLIPAANRLDAILLLDGLTPSLQQATVVVIDELR